MFAAWQQIISLNTLDISGQLLATDAGLSSYSDLEALKGTVIKIRNILKHLFLALMNKVNNFCNSRMAELKFILAHILLSSL